MSHRSYRKGHRWLYAIGAIAGMTAMASTPAMAKPGSFEMPKDAIGPGAEHRVSTAVRPRNKRPQPPTIWIDGPDVSNRTLVLKWLDGLDPGTRVRLPVGITRSPLGGVEHATVLGGPLAAGARGKRPDALALALDDSRLGISLADRIRAACGAQTEKPCAIWIMGEWRAKPLLPTPGKPSDLVPFAVTDTGERVRSHPNAPPRVARAAAAVEAVREVEAKASEVKPGEGKPGE